jgi:hypothetical protein
MSPRWRSNAFRIRPRSRNSQLPQPLGLHWRKCPSLLGPTPTRGLGNLGNFDMQANEQALKDGGRILSKYLLKDGTPIYVITEADRSYTTVMLVGDY